MLETVHLGGKPLRIGRFWEELVWALNMAATWSHRTGVDVWITSINDHTHKEDSLHYRDMAVDFDTEHSADLQRLARYLKAHLDHRYDVVMEGSHVHVEVEVAK